MDSAIDYYNASGLRLLDSNQLQADKQRIISAIYLAGLSVECMLRAYHAKNNVATTLDSRHDLMVLFAVSDWKRSFNFSQQAEILDEIRKVSKLWNNGVRYYSTRKFKQLLLDKIPGSDRARITNVNTYAARNYKDFFKAVDFIIEKGKQTWT